MRFVLKHLILFKFINIICIHSYLSFLEIYVGVTLYNKFLIHEVENLSWYDRHKYIHETTITIKILNISTPPKVLSCLFIIIPPQAITDLFSTIVCIFYERNSTEHTPFFLAGFFYSAYCIWDPSMLLHVPVVYIYHWVVCCCIACNFLHKLCREQQNHTDAGARHLIYLWFIVPVN